MLNKKFLIIQTASIGDVILATPIIEKLHACFPESIIDVLVKKGTDGLFQSHPKVRRVYVWNKSKNKYKNLFIILKEVRSEKYTHAINLQRFASTGLFTFFSGANVKIGFNKNPFSFLYNKSVVHNIDTNSGLHEIDRNLMLIEELSDKTRFLPRLYPAASDFDFVSKFKNEPYLCMAPASLWFTKQFPESRWVELSNYFCNYRIYLVGAPGDKDLCSRIIATSSNKKIQNLAGELSFLQTAALMKDAKLNLVNDSAPMHIASSQNAPVVAIFCSTIPEFGFGPLSEKSQVVQVSESLACRPCGLHGHKECPEKHFNCAHQINISQITIP